MHDKKNTLLYKWFTEVWNNGDETAIDRMMHGETAAYGIVAESEPRGAEGFKVFYNGFTSRFKDINIDIEDVITEDDLEAARLVVNAVEIQSGKPVKFTGICMAKISDGKISEAWNNFDFLGMYEQLGQKLAAE